MADDSDNGQWYALSEGDVKAFRMMYEDYKVRRLRPLRFTTPESDTLTPEVYVARTPFEAEGVDEDTTVGTATSTAITGDDVPSYVDCQVYRVTGEDSDPRLEPISGLIKRVFNIGIDIIPAGTWFLVTRDKFGTWWSLFTPPPMVKGKLTSTMTFVEIDTGTGTLNYSTASATMAIWAWNGYREVDTGFTVTVYDWLMKTHDSIASGKHAVAFYCPRSRKYYLTNAQC